MRERRRNNKSVILNVIMGLITVTALTICMVFICLYIKTIREMKVVSSSLKETQDKIEKIDIGIQDEEMGQYSEDEDGNEEIGQKEEEEQNNSNVIFQTFNNEEFFKQMDKNTLDMVKQKMQDMVSNKEIGPVTMIRYFFPEKLIFYDNGGYVFEDILDGVKKHEYHADNFVINEAGEIQYKQDGNVISHKAIDVSKYQGNIDWGSVAADGVEYAFIRLGIRGYKSGEIVLDDTYETNMMNAQNAGIKTGVYFFSQAISVEEALDEADFTIQNLEGYDVNCPVVLDIEMITEGNGRANYLSKEERTEIVKAFCDKILQAGYTPMIYGNIKCFVNMLDIKTLENYEKWFAFYDNYLYFPYELSMWQYTEKGKINGIQGKVDINICFKEW